jgi:hypothetical protein
MSENSKAAQRCRKRKSMAQVMAIQTLRERPEEHRRKAKKAANVCAHMPRKSIYRESA